MTETDIQNIQSFLTGTSHTSYDYFGIHESEDKFTFRVFAPKATKVMLTGDFNEWRDDILLEKIDDSGVWQVDIPSYRIKYGNRYKYRIYGCGQVSYKSDPYSPALSPSPDNSSVVCRRNEYRWKDNGWLGYRSTYQKNISSRPVNIYELHLGSWKRRGKSGCFSYRDYARELAPYVKQMGYTHVCLLPIMEFFDDHKLDYAPSSFFAPTSRYGTPDDLKAFVDKLHEAGVGVIFDIPVARFPKERYGLFEFDGSMLYERDADEHRRHFDLTKGWVQSFLLSSISYGISEFHADAIRIADVDELLNFYSEENNEKNNIAKRFLRSMIRTMKNIYPDVLFLGEGAGEDIGFDLVFDNRWNDRLLDYSSVEFDVRTEKTVALAEFVEKNDLGTLSLPHIDPIHTRNTFIETMAGDYWQKFAGLRALSGLMMTVRGKKLSFMGNEIAQFRSWTFDRETEWFLLDFESHEKFQRYAAELNNFYLAHPALWQRDATAESFSFIDRDTFGQGILIFRRSSKQEDLAVVVNLSPNSYEDYRIGAQGEGVFREIFNSDQIKYYGSGVINNSEIETEKIAYHGYKNSFSMKIPPLAISILSFRKKAKNKRK